ncbi:unnamed protein product [Medioppia subpectinata]|uniref:Legumain prodomain domain-containing protein n=1 Tax=Medioppia subpectinata TaxID=1979941 RepID=A0A7R9KFD4_9ACAR|nr:unnamed protein product [Medioppia subpectinata]CAG2102299.1 unnamed protein product [Medioppia subpectinata]
MQSSMFDKLLPNNINAYAVSASSPDQVSWQAFCDDPQLKACYGTLFGYYWMMDIQRLTSATLQQQFDNIFAFTNNSDRPVEPGDTQQAQQYGKQKIMESIDDSVNEVYSRVNTRDLPLFMAKSAVKQTLSITEKIRYTEKLQKQLNSRQYVDKHMTDYVNSIQHLLTVDSNAILNTKQELNNRQCYRKLVDSFHKNCFNLNKNPYVLGKLYIFVNICEEMRESSDADINAVNQLLIQFLFISCVRIQHNHGQSLYHDDYLHCKAFHALGYFSLIHWLPLPAQSMFGSSLKSSLIQMADSVFIEHNTRAAFDVIESPGGERMVGQRIAGQLNVHRVLGCTVVAAYSKRPFGHFFNRIVTSRSAGKSSKAPVPIVLIGLLAISISSSDWWPEMARVGSDVTLVFSMFSPVSPCRVPLVDYPFRDVHSIDVNGSYVTFSAVERPPVYPFQTVGLVPANALAGSSSIAVCRLMSPKMARKSNGSSPPQFMAQLG